MQKIKINKKILIFQIKDRDLFTTLMPPKGASIYELRKNFLFFDPLPLVTYRIHATSFLSSAFLGPPSPPTADIIYGSPLFNPVCLDGAVSTRLGEREPCVWGRVSPKDREIRRRNERTQFDRAHHEEGIAALLSPVFNFVLFLHRNAH